MPINLWHLDTLSSNDKEAILARSETDIDSVISVVAPIVADVKQRGDAALRDYAQRFERCTLQGSLRATDAEFEAAYQQVEPAVIAAIKHCVDNVRTHHQQQMDRVEKQWLDEVKSGVFAGEKITPLPSVGLYVPRGKGAFPSMMYMLCIPAKIAGVPKIAVCTPPTPEGGIDAASLVTADLCGVRTVYKAGGAQAIAALAYGTETIPKVCQVNGPGSPYVAAAKRLLGHVINAGMPAGPSESIVLADEGADPWNTALDMINEAEHGADSATLLVTPSQKLADAVMAYLPQIIASLPAPRNTYCETVFSRYGGIMICPTMDAAISFCNDYAVEHLLVKVANPMAVLEYLTNAGEILIGETTPMVMGNFGIGSNAVLPTGGHARTYSCTSVWSFLKRTSLAYLTPAGYESLKDPVTILARYEGFEGHVKAITERNESAFG